MNEFNTDNRFCLIAGPKAATKIDSFDDGNPNDGAFQRHPKSEKVEDYTQDIYCAYFDHPDFGTFQENLLDPEGFFTRWRTPERETDPKAADMLDLLDNVENPEKLVIRLPANALSTLPWLQWIFKNDVTGDEETYPGTETHKIRMEFDRYDLPDYLPEQLEIYHGDMESKFADNATIGPKYLYRTGYFNLYDLREQQMEREAASEERTVETQPGQVTATDVEIVEEMDPADVEEPVSLEVETAPQELIPLDELFHSNLSSEVITEFYEPLIDIEAGYQRMISDLQNPQFGNLADPDQLSDARQETIKAEAKLNSMRTDVDALMTAALSTHHEMFGGKTLKGAFIVRLLTTRERIDKELDDGGDREIHIQRISPPIHIHRISPPINEREEEIQIGGRPYYVTTPVTEHIELEAADGETYFVTLKEENGQKVIDKVYFDDGDGEFYLYLGLDKKFSSKKQREFIKKLGLPSQLIRSLKGMPVRALEDYLSSTMESESSISLYLQALETEKEKDDQEELERLRAERERPEPGDEEVGGPPTIDEVRAQFEDSLRPEMEKLIRGLTEDDNVSGRMTADFTVDERGVSMMDEKLTVELYNENGERLPENQESKIGKKGRSIIWAATNSNPIPPWAGKGFTGHLRVSWLVGDNEEVLSRLADEAEVIGTNGGRVSSGATDLEDVDSGDVERRGAGESITVITAEATPSRLSGERPLAASEEEAMQNFEDEFNPFTVKKISSKADEEKIERPSGLFVWRVTIDYATGLITKAEYLRENSGSLPLELIEPVTRSIVDHSNSHPIPNWPRMPENGTYTRDVRAWRRSF